VPGVYEKGEKQLRVIKLFTRLCETEVGLTTRQLAEELEVNPRTVQRYVATLRDSAGIDIEETDGRWRIGKRSLLPPLQLDHYQATLLLVAVRLLQQVRTEQDPALVGALAHLSRALSVPIVSEYLRHTLAAAERRPLAIERLGVERAVIDGFVTHRAVEVRYVDAKGNETRRDLRPYFIEPTAEGRHIYVFAHDSVSREVRSFRLDRIRTARLLPTSFAVPDDFDIDIALGAAWAIWQGPGGDHVVLRFPEAVRQMGRRGSLAIRHAEERPGRRRHRGPPRRRQRGRDAPLADALGGEHRGARARVASASYGRHPRRRGGTVRVESAQTG